MNVYYAIGLMSGTSLDGVDLALCQFEFNKQHWKHKLLNTATYSYPKEWKQKLSVAHELDSYPFIKLHKEFGQYLGQLVNRFSKGMPIKINLIGSHGHTIFHNPDEKITFQIGDGNMIAAETGITTISDFRTLDVALGGQGAPLVPIGDELLFKNFDYCLNLGGFANISYSSDSKRIGFDICAVNMAINYLSSEAGKEFDKDGFLAMKGKVDDTLLEHLNSQEFYKISPPKSLGREWYEHHIYPLISNKNILLEDRLRTYYEHVGIQISLATKTEKQKSILVTGGGALNKFLVQIIKKHSHHQFVIPDNQLIEFKEALIFAFLGVLRLRNEINVLSSYTGAKTDSISGIIHLANP